MRTTFFLLTAIFTAGALAGEGLHPVKLSQQQIAGEIWEDHEPVVATEGGVTTHDVEIFLTEGKDFDAGMWRSTEAHWDITDPYPYNEYMHILEGGVTLTSADGTVTDLAPGDSVVIPRGWTGRWDSPGVTKIYVIHAPDGDL